MDPDANLAEQEALILANRADYTAMTTKPFPQPRVCAVCGKPGTAAYTRKIASTGKNESAYLCRKDAPTWLKHGDRL